MDNQNPEYNSSSEELKYRISILEKLISTHAGNQTKIAQIETLIQKYNAQLNTLEKSNPQSSPKVIKIDDMFSNDQSIYSQQIINYSNLAHENGYGEGHLQFAAMASIAQYVNTDLLYTLWLNFQNYLDDKGATRQFSRLVVADLLNSELCKHIGSDVYYISSKIKKRLFPYLLKCLDRESKNNHSNSLKNFDSLAQFFLRYFERPDNKTTFLDKQIEILKLNVNAYYDPTYAKHVLDTKFINAFNSKKGSDIELIQLGIITQNLWDSEQVVNNTSKEQRYFGDIANQAQALTKLINDQELDLELLPSQKFVKDENGIEVTIQSENKERILETDLSTDDQPEEIKLPKFIDSFIDEILSPGIVRSLMNQFKGSGQHIIHTSKVALLDTTTNIHDKQKFLRLSGYREIFNYSFEQAIRQTKLPEYLKALQLLKINSSATKKLVTEFENDGYIEYNEVKNAKLVNPFIREFLGNHFDDFKKLKEWASNFSLNWNNYNLGLFPTKNHMWAEVAYDISTSGTMDETLLGLKSYFPKLSDLDKLLKKLNSQQKVIDKKLEAFIKSDSSTLDLSNLSIVKFPFEILELKNLISLNLSNNYISVIPSELFSIDSLKNIDLSNNRILRVPESIRYNENISELKIDKNPIKNIPLAVLDSGIVETKNYFLISRFRAIIIGNQNYSSELKFKSLKHPISDTNKLEGYLKSNTKIESVLKLKDESRANIISEIENVNTQLNEGDTMLFYFSGYGGKENGHVEEYDKFICCSDYSASGVPNRISHFELQSLFLPILKKDCKVTCILDCGYSVNKNNVPSNENANSGLNKKSIDTIYSLRDTSDLYYNVNNFNPGEVWHYNFTSIQVAQDNELVYEGKTGSVFLERFFEITLNSEKDSNLNNVLRKKLDTIYIREEYNSYNSDKNSSTQTIKIWNYPNQDDKVLLEEFLLTGEELVERRIENSIGTLNLSGLQLDSLPTSVFNKNRVSKIILSNNYFNRIPDLRNFSLENEITYLALDNNQISNIEHTLFLYNLKTLNLSKNNIESTKGIENNTNLERLYLSDNNLTDITHLGNLTKLSRLHLSRNKLTNISSLAFLTNLVRIHLASNNLEILPEFLVNFNQPILWTDKLPKLGIAIKGNPFKNPPIEILKQGNVAIENYFFSFKFYTEEQIFDVVQKESKLKEAEKPDIGLLIFSTLEQQTWLVVNSRKLFIVLDDKEARSKNSLVQKVVDFKIVLDSLSAQRHSNNDEPTVTLYPNGNWFYSFSLFPNPSVLKESIKRLVSTHDKTDESYPILWALVTGTSNKEEFRNNPFLDDSCKHLAKALMKNNIGLVTSNWYGVDQTISMYYLNELYGTKYNTSNFVKLYDSKEETISSEISDKVTIVDLSSLSFEKATPEILDLADMVFVIGGAEGAYHLGSRAITRDMYTIPLVETKGAAQDLYENYFFDIMAIDPMYRKIKSENLNDQYYHAIDSSLSIVLKIDLDNLNLYLNSSNGFQAIYRDIIRSGFSQSENSDRIYLQLLFSLLELSEIQNIKELNHLYFQNIKRFKDISQLARKNWEVGRYFIALLLYLISLDTASYEKISHLVPKRLNELIRRMDFS